MLNQRYKTSDHADGVFRRVYWSRRSKGPLGSRAIICYSLPDILTSLKERLPEILRGYDKKNVYNLDETGCFWKALPQQGFAEKGKQCRGGKKSKRFTTASMVNAAGEKEKPVVIWKSANPRCFRGFDKCQLPVKYYDQQKAWMTGDILDSYLLNSKVKAERRCILLFLDNAGCHPANLQDK